MSSKKWLGMLVFFTIGKTGRFFLRENGESKDIKQTACCEGGNMQAIRLVNTNELSHREWLAWRRRGITGSDVGAICGVDPYRSALAVYLEKTGQMAESEDTEAMHFGRMMEEVVAEEFSRRTGYKLQPRNAILQHPEKEWVIGNIDRLIIDAERGNGVLEIKTASEYARKEWEDGNVPEAYQLQLQWYLYITGLTWGAFAVLIGGNTFRHQVVARDDELIALSFRICEHFWHHHVLAGVPPLSDGSEATAALLANIYPEGEVDSTLILPDEAEELIAQWEKAERDIQEAAQRKQEAENRLKALIGRHETGLTSAHRVTWKNVSRRTLDIKALKEQRPDIYEQFARPAVSRRFIIT
ncbi:YqaJ viral recombinase family protein [Aneurinibacillus thermoaerophilus]|uniref:YqaJ viral recombinase family nuclease n=2 Tax=Aneurinibacillus thermoaerophilus TaxID=143495 RepID=UPI002E1AA1A1|nr:YqaJ viral recombinase family protein [Aneurinibacillus thermoaerophilus]